MGKERNNEKIIEKIVDHKSLFAKALVNRAQT